MTNTACESPTAADDVAAFDVDHRPVVPTFGFRIDYGGYSVVLSGDTRPSENLVKFAQGTDLLIHEVLAPKDFSDRMAHLTPHHRQQVINHHTTAEQAGEIFQRVAPKLAVYTHIIGGPNAQEELIEDTKASYSGAIEVGEDLMAIEVGDEVTIINDEESN